MADRALVFKILRLQPPLLDVSLNSSFDLAVDTAQDRITSAVPPAPLDPVTAPFAHRVQFDGSRTAGGVGGTLLVPQAFGQVYIGQVVTFSVSATNAAAAVVQRVGLRVELHGDRTKAVLLDTLSAPNLGPLRPGEQLEVLVNHDVKELGQHTLSCAAAYAAADGERFYTSQPFRFTAANPMVVRTKHRFVGETVFLEATLENRTKAPMLLDSVRLAASAPYVAERLDPPPAADAGPLSSYIAGVPLLPPEGGAFSYVFRLDRPDAMSSVDRGADVDGGSALGKLEIRWRGPMCDAARLQTQLITMPPAPSRELLLSLRALPPWLHVEQPFAVEAVIRSASDRRLGPLKLSYSASAAGTAGIVMEGPQSIVVDEVAPRGCAVVAVQLVPLQVGTHLIQGIMLTDERDGRMFDSLKPVEVFVHCGPVASQR